VRKGEARIAVEPETFIVRSAVAESIGHVLRSLTELLGRS
jgi:hypothetical protein